MSAVELEHSSSSSSFTNRKHTTQLLQVYYQSSVLGNSEGNIKICHTVIIGRNLFKEEKYSDSNCRRLGNMDAAFFCLAYTIGDEYS